MSGEGYSGRLWDDDGSEDGRGAEYGADADAPRREYSPDELADEITLASVDGVGPLTAFRLIEYFGSVGGMSTSGLMSHWTGSVRSNLYTEILTRISRNCV